MSRVLWFLVAVVGVPAWAQDEPSGLRHELESARRERMYATNSARRSDREAQKAAIAELAQLARLEGRVSTLLDRQESPIYMDRRLAGKQPPEGQPSTPKEAREKPGKRPAKAPSPPPSPLARVTAEERLAREAKAVAEARALEAKGRRERYIKQLDWAQLWARDAVDQRTARDSRLRQEIGRSVLELAKQMELEAAGKDLEPRR